MYQYNIYLIKGLDGKIYAVAVDDHNVTVQFSIDGKYFEAEGYHLKEWCSEEGFEYKKIEVEQDLKELWEKTQEK